MPIVIKSLKNGKIPQNTPDTGSTLTIAEGKSVIVKSMRFANPSGSSANYRLKFTPSGGTERTIGGNLINANSVLADNAEITMGPEDVLKAYSTNSDNVLEFVWSGIERDV